MTQRISSGLDRTNSAISSHAEKSGRLGSGMNRMDSDAKVTGRRVLEPYSGLEHAGKVSVNLALRGPGSNAVPADQILIVHDGHGIQGFSPSCQSQFGEPEKKLPRH